MEQVRFKLEGDPVKSSISGKTREISKSGRISVPGPITHFYENIGPITYRPGEEEGHTRAEYYFRGILQDLGGGQFEVDYKHEGPEPRGVRILDLLSGSRVTISNTRTNTHLTLSAEVVPNSLSKSGVKTSEPIGV